MLKGTLEINNEQVVKGSEIECYLIISSIILKDDTMTFDVTFYDMRMLPFLKDVFECKWDLSKDLLEQCASFLLSIDRFKHFKKVSYESSRP